MLRNELEQIVQEIQKVATSRACYPHSHGTRANFRKTMEQLEQNHAAMREDVDSIKFKMDKLLELFQTLGTKENTTRLEENT
ncbi:hypothetical protein A2U01_0041595 [Trifolium medium]|uniref:Uncharacterized protein n=1 Tax=Trifolium medium TaxID=97028 RepID=A0A392Q7R0_9FABA|nr:hypothetical protein [Trifolium medium]